MTKPPGRHGDSKLNLLIEVPRYLLRVGRHFAAHRFGDRKK